jgi:hypothetical protein
MQPAEAPDRESDLKPVEESLNESAGIAVIDPGFAVIDPGGA